jgi:hypothetical protein
MIPSSLNRSAITSEPYAVDFDVAIHDGPLFWNHGSADNGFEWIRIW